MPRSRRRSAVALAALAGLVGVLLSFGTAPPTEAAPAQGRGLRHDQVPAEGQPEGQGPLVHEGLEATSAPPRPRAAATPSTWRPAPTTCSSSTSATTYVTTKYAPDRHPGDRPHRRGHAEERHDDQGRVHHRHGQGQRQGRQEGRGQGGQPERAVLHDDCQQEGPVRDRRAARGQVLALQLRPQARLRRQEHLRRQAHAREVGEPRDQPEEEGRQPARLPLHLRERRRRSR